MSKGCILCQIVKGKLPSYKIYEDDKVLGILDIYPIAKGHCLVIPKKHIVWYTDLTKNDYEPFSKAMWIVARKLKKTFKARYVTILIRDTRIPHLHAHLVPGIKGEASAMDRILNFFQYIQEHQKPVVSLAEMKKIAKAIKAANQLTA